MSRSGDPARQSAPHLAMWYWGPVVVCVAAISLVSHRPLDAIPGGAPDWILHAIEFGLLCALVLRAGRASGWPSTGATTVGVLAACTAFGAIDEIHQSFVPGREATLADVAADGLGAALAVASALVLRARRRRRAGGDPIRITLVGRSKCDLCDEAAEVIDDAAREYDVRVVTADIDSDATLRDRYADDIPVVLIDDREVFRHRVQPRRLRRELFVAYRRRQR